MMHPLLFLLTEDDNDDLFLEACAEKISGISFQLQNPRRVRKASGISGVRKAIGPFLNDLKGFASMDAFFIIALDNDRSPDHENEHRRIKGLSTFDTSKACRVCEITRMIEGAWGQNRTSWPVCGAIAVPVEMIESWILLSLDPKPKLPLPIFPKKEAAAAQNFFSGNPPDQLKDLFEQHRGSATKAEFVLEAGRRLDVEAVAASSKSFAAFRDQVIRWQSGDSSPKIPSI